MRIFSGKGTKLWWHGEGKKGITAVQVHDSFNSKMQC